jgi:hypoxanthine phosphoribosyltransferase
MFRRDIEKIINIIKQKNWKLKYVYGPPRGGCILAVLLSHHLDLKYLTTLNNVVNPEEVLLCDDVSDSGKTLLNIKNINKYKTLTLYIKPETLFIPNIWLHQVKQFCWIVYWWEKKYYR